jgi:alpha-D-xyloside xylohydrolase
MREETKMSIFNRENNRLLYHFDAEEVWIEAWESNSLRIRATKQSAMTGENWALISNQNEQIHTEISIDEKRAAIINGNIRAEIDQYGSITVYNKIGKKILEEYSRNRRDITSRKCSALEIEGREFKPIPGGDYHLTVRFESLDSYEKIYGMGQYQQPYLNLQGADLELAHRNSQASVPFALSSLGYGFLWNNPGIGRAVFGKNIPSFEVFSTKEMDYWITVADTPAEIIESYTAVTGRVPMMPDYAMGFWQCKLRYQTQEELLNIAREYKNRGLPISVIVIDFFHWPKQGDWKFDQTYWPDPDAMVKELKDMGIELMVSIWPTVDKKSENYHEMLEKGYLIRTDRGVRVGLDFQGTTTHIDVTNPAARTYLWQKIKQNYFDKGIKIFWLDEAEPEYTIYDFDNYRYYIGSNLQIGNMYPLMYAQAFFEGQTQERQENVINLLRCAWVGSQKYGALVWSGDIASSFEIFRNQLIAGLNMGIAGLPWWTTDIGGFHGGDPKNQAFQELLIRWFQWGTFCPVMRLYDDREPRQPQFGMTGGAACCSGADNEVWSFGEEAYAICKKYLNIRKAMQPYIKKIMAEAHQKGTPVMRPPFYDFPSDSITWEIEDEYMFGPDYLVSPILYSGQREREVYLPADSNWTYIWTGEKYDGGTRIIVEAPIEHIPVFTRCRLDDWTLPHLVEKNKEVIHKV